MQRIRRGPLCSIPSPMQKLRSPWKPSKRIFEALSDKFNHAAALRYRDLKRRGLEEDEKEMESEEEGNEFEEDKEADNFWEEVAEP